MSTISCPICGVEARVTISGKSNYKHSTDNSTRTGVCPTPPKKNGETCETLDNAIFAEANRLRDKLGL